MFKNDLEFNNGIPIFETENIKKILIVHFVSFVRALEDLNDKFCWFGFAGASSIKRNYGFNILRRYPFFDSFHHLLQRTNYL
jgi:hypothetical protein